MASLDNCIVNIGFGGLRYTYGTKRLVGSLKQVGYIGDSKCIEGLPKDFISHTDNPYAFKLQLLKQIVDAGYKKILWVDSNVYAFRNPQPIFDIIDSEGYYAINNGFNCAQTCTDNCLNYFGVDRDKAEQMPEITTCVVGFNMDFEIGRQFFERWYNSAMDGAFKGSREHSLSDSEDPRFLFGRQDQSAASIIANQLNFKLHSYNDHVSYLEAFGMDESNLPESVIFVNKGL